MVWTNTMALLVSYERKKKFFKKNFSIFCFFIFFILDFVFNAFNGSFGLRWIFFHHFFFFLISFLFLILSLFLFLVLFYFFKIYFQWFDFSLGQLWRTITHSWQQCKRLFSVALRFFVLVVWKTFVKTVGQKS